MWVGLLRYVQVVDQVIVSEKDKVLIVRYVVRKKLFGAASKGRGIMWCPGAGRETKEGEEGTERQH